MLISRVMRYRPLMGSKMGMESSFKAHIIQPRMCLKGGLGRGGREGGREGEKGGRERKG